MAEDGVDKTALPASLLRGRVAIVTGGARGIGRATVLRLAEAGADVVINYARNEEAAEEVARRAREFGVRALPLRADVSEVDQAAALVERTVEQFGKVDLLVQTPASGKARRLKSCPKRSGTGSSTPTSKGHGRPVMPLYLS